VQRICDSLEYGKYNFSRLYLQVLRNLSDSVHMITYFHDLQVKTTIKMRPISQACSTKYTSLTLSDLVWLIDLS
jgi:hypothetical protein